MMRKLFSRLTLAALLVLARPAFAAAPTPKPSPRNWTAADVEKQLEAAGRKALQAKSPEELDGPRGELLTLQRELERHPELTNYRQDAGGVSYFLQEWQVFLRKWTANQRKEAFAELQTILNDDRWVGWIPRSEVQARWLEWQPLHRCTYPRDTIEDLAKAVAAVQQLKKEVGRELDTPVGEYELLENLYEGRARKNWDEIVEACRRPTSNVDIQRFQQLLLAYAVAGYLKLEPRYDLPPEKSALAVEQLDRIIQLARTNGDLVTEWRAGTFRNALTGNPPPWRVQPLTALDAYLGAQKLEAEGKRARAVGLYRKMLDLRCGPALLAKAGERLAALKKDFPEEYEQATRRTVLRYPVSPGSPAFAAMYPGLADRVPELLYGQPAPSYPGGPGPYFGMNRPPQQPEPPRDPWTKY